jgi:hypothetical protein
MNRLDLDERARRTIDDMTSDWGAAELHVMHNRDLAIFTGAGCRAIVVVPDTKAKESDIAEIIENLKDEEPAAREVCFSLTNMV